MCGILAYLSHDGNGIPEDTFLRMRDTMIHRGPDGEGVYAGDGVRLGHRRLAIIDLTESGHQPMTNEDGSLQLVYNGEIYNYVELMKELIGRGHKFRSKTDSEVILHQYEEDGEDCVRKFNGMFAFVVWDGRRGRLFAARDRFGIKPLYCYRDGARTLFASEIKAILEAPFVPREPDPRAIADYLFAERPLGGKTFFRHISELQPGCRMVVDQRTGDASGSRYWDLKYRYETGRSDVDVAEELHQLLDDSVRIHCRSDAPLGCHLSGGLDSSLIVAFAASYRDNLKTFSIRFSDDPYIDETRYARMVANHVGAQYIESRPTGADMARLLPFLVWHMDYPMATDGGFAYYAVSNLARLSVKVSLTGHGGDEIFAGYPAQFQAAFGNTEMFSFRPDPHRVRQYSPMLRFRHFIHGKGPVDIARGFVRRFRKISPSLDEDWIRMHCGREPTWNPVFAEGFRRSLGGYTPREEYLRPLHTAGTEEVLDRCLYHDLTSYLPGLLHLEDRVSMSVSVESRVPYLDYRIAEFMATVPPAQKVMQLRPKHLLRQAGGRLLPEEVRDRKEKYPFPVPGKFWMTPEMRSLIREVLLSPEARDRGVFRPSVLKWACEGTDKDLLWVLLNTELWFQIFFDRNPRWLEAIEVQRANVRESQGCR
jgi:asparagine synthase (glutamine-hydrolysing)